MDKTESTVRNMLTAIEAPLYDIGVLSDRGMLPGIDGIPAASGTRPAFAAQIPQRSRLPYLHPAIGRTSLYRPPENHAERLLAKAAKSGPLMV
jgi:hypothetical protein